ncbi:MAG: penicillin acylase family protein [Vicinamibacterales bacterium]|nr:penicillin acylase family protein [Vicinamibacterales bacterium]
MLTWLGRLVLVVVLLAAAVLAWFRIELGRSLPHVDGERPLAGLSAPVTVARDAQGVPFIEGATREDVARALGYVHAQERFFQMDLARRRAAGELSELVGESTRRLDRQTRVLGLRQRAREAIVAASEDDRRVLRAYTEGVNAGLAALGARPFEYILLRAAPRPWQDEDCGLVLGSMFLQLQDAFGARERRLTLVHEMLPREMAEFVTTTESEWATPLVGGPGHNPAVPGPEVLDLRSLPKAARLETPGAPVEATTAWMPPSLAESSPEALPGSNNWAVAGTHTADGAALVANDMHLGLSVPHIWYRASLAWSGGPAGRVTGVTLPGVPSLIVGSNGAIAWGFTNTTADWTDLVRLEVDPADSSRYRTPDGWRPFTTRVEDVAVARAEGERVEVRETIWGPVAEPDARGRLHAIAWVPLRPGGLNMRALAMERAAGVEEAFAIGATLGIPAQNLVVAGRDGRIGWSIAGRIPRRVGFDGRLSGSWADGARRWDGWVEPGAYPRVVAPASGRIATANNRLVEGDALALVGDGGYDPGARMRQIVEGLAGIERATPRDMLAVQLDDRALFLERWRALLLRTLAPGAVAGSETRRDLQRVVNDTWTGRASQDSAAYRLVRDFRLRVGELAFGPVFADIRKVDPTISVVAGRGGEGALWALVSARPAHLLPPAYPTWVDLLLAAADKTAADAVEASGSMAGHTWGRFNAARIQHPLSRAVPQLAWWLDAPVLALAGDAHMPRVQVQDFGASQRMAVSPGREADGFFHMPGGQSGHPLSPHYRDMHAAWVNGEPTPFLPGPPVHVLTLRPPPGGQVLNFNIARHQ